ncbi:hypothetical protein HAX54_051722 [Datura stramonium]|uniref:Uncharacterized protein n=1 Tax=Datura stramonium TaxID=4076 RepID=A0ABS8WQ52_DATST|nr:hypothetical protein [Datura stramonium]
MVVTRVIKAMGVDVSSFPVKEISSTYNNRAFSSMGYVLDDGVWVKKFSYKPKIKHASPGGLSGVKIDESQGAVLNSPFLKPRKSNNHLVQCAREVFDNELAVVVQNSYSSLSTRIEKSYHSFFENIINTLKCFLGRR